MKLPRIVAMSRAAQAQTRMIVQENPDVPYAIILPIGNVAHIVECHHSADTKPV